MEDTTSPANAGIKAQQSDLVLVPVRLDAFVLNEHVCNGGEIDAKIAPITQPNYTFLRLEEFYIQNDILNHVDIHATNPASRNSRFTDLRTSKPRQNRQGVYLHWILPRMYRVSAVSKDGSSESQKHQMAPTRWLIVRHLDLTSISPPNADANEVEAWVIESDRKRDLNDESILDMQVDVSPFVAVDNKENISIRKQAEIFVGKKTPLRSWEEDPNADRVAISLFNSSNQLFPDYQPHNSNVFSMVDPLEYANGTKKLSKAKASYYVIGWHAQEGEDPLSSNASTTRGDKLKQLAMALKDKTLAGIDGWLNDKSASSVLCHGAMYDIEWDTSCKPEKVLADEFSKKLNEKLPVSIGETPIDALLAFVEAHKTNDNGTIQKLETSIDAIRLLLRAQDEGVESQRQAEDSLSSTHFMNDEGGVVYHVTGSGEDDGKNISDTDKVKLAEINKTQTLLDSATRTKRQMQWDMFSLWWRYLSNPSSVTEASEIRLDVQSLTRRATAIAERVRNLAEEVETLKKALPQAKPGARPPFRRALDPTLLFGGISTGWPHDFLEDIKVRLSSQTSTPTPDSSVLSPFSQVFADVERKTPSKLHGPVLALLKEFIALKPSAPLVQESSNFIYPVFHDQQPGTASDSKRGWRDRWEGTQPWFPLFMEWEAEYTHIPFDKWELHTSTSSRSTVQKLAYRIKEDVNLDEEKITDQRLVSGRVLILPQPVVSLRTMVKQLFADTPAALLDTYLSSDQRTELLEKFDQLAFLSAPLSGFLDHLTTKFQGSHIKPSAKLADGAVTIKSALDSAREGGFKAESLAFIGDETDLTPYGTSVPAAQGTRMFKPVTHGQFRLTKVNIFDKFGQVIHAINPSPTSNDPLYPCISETLRPQPLATEPSVANTVRKDLPTRCEFVQLPPHINQMARINAHFIAINPHPTKRDAPPVYGRLQEHENPVWGWIVVNYPNSGIQIFLPDGTFYREIRFGGPKGTLESENWLPFGAPKEEDVRFGKDPVNQAQLHALIEQLKKPAYLGGFVKMIAQSARNSPAAPNAYAETLNSIIGKPLALVNAAWSLEIASDAYTNQSDFNTDIAETMGLLDSVQSPGTTPTQYEFPIQIGDKNRLFDGMIGYFNPREGGKAGDYYHLGKLHTFYADNRSSNDDPRYEQKPSEYPKLAPTWVPPFNQSDPPTSATSQAVTPDSYSKAYNKNLHVVGAIIDPFTAINVYSGILPPKGLKVLPWVWQDTFQKMTAFFHLGPLIMTKDVPPFDSSKQLTSDWKDVAPIKSDVRMYTTQSVDWVWLQPYAIPAVEKDDSGPESKDLETRFMPLSIGQVEPGLRFDPGPSTAIEGYLQMMKSVE